MTGAPYPGRIAAALGAAAIVAALGLAAWRHGERTVAAASAARSSAALGDAVHPDARRADAPVGPPSRAGAASGARTTGAATRAIAAPTSIPANVARLAWRPVAGDAPGAIAGFALFGDTVVALDPPGSRVVLLALRGDTVRTIGAWGRRGDGPGELRQPVALARAGPDAVAIVDAGGRGRRFDLRGRVVAVDLARAPCPAFAPTIVYARDARAWLAANCVGAPPAHDTIFTVVHQLGAGAPAERTRTPRMALDLSWGSAFGTLHPLVDLDTAVLFAPGLDGCALRLDKPGARPAPGDRRCDLVRERLRAREPASLRRDRRAAEARGDRRQARLLRWPDPLPPWFAAVAASDALLLLRPISGDTLVAVPAERPFDVRQARLAAPIRHLVTCARGACLWYDGEHLALWRPEAR